MAFLVTALIIIASAGTERRDKSGGEVGKSLEIRRRVLGVELGDGERGDALVGHEHLERSEGCFERDAAAAAGVFGERRVFTMLRWSTPPAVVSSGRPDDMMIAAMCVAALYDIHGNLPALEAVLAEVPEDATILLGGDYVYGPFPKETLARLHDLGKRAIWLRGNCDRELSEPGTGPASLDVLDWVRDRLGADEIRFLHGLPATATLTIEGLGEVFFCHATPRNDVDFFTDATPAERLAPILADAKAATIVCGHSHLQFERTVAGKDVINAGSVGMAYEDKPGAYWALLGPKVELRRSPFTPASLAESGYPRPWPTPGRAEATGLLEAEALGSQAGS